MTEHHCKENENNTVISYSDLGGWEIEVADPYYDFKIIYCPFCGIKLPEVKK